MKLLGGFSYALTGNTLTIFPGSAEGNQALSVPAQFELTAHASRLADGKSEVVIVSFAGGAVRATAHKGMIPREMPGEVRLWKLTLDAHYQWQVADLREFAPPPDGA